MRVLIAPDKFKGTLTARAAAEAIAAGWRRARPKDELTLLPISDGGDGFGSVLSQLIQARRHSIRTVDAAHRQITAPWWWHPETRTAVIESANSIGLAMLERGKFHPFDLDTHGLAAPLRSAQRLGARRIVLGIGGSATNDGGFGLARALGWRFLDHSGAEIRAWTRLTELNQIERPRHPFPRRRITVAVDVQNPLLGKRGATRIYGPQKGLRSEDFDQAEACLRRLATVTRRRLGVAFASQPGAGAAGGLGFGLATFAGARLVSGFGWFARQAGLARKLKNADLLITGEGASDLSTLMGKGAGEIARLGRAQNLPVLGLAGIVGDAQELRRLFTATHALVDLTSAANARRRAAFWLAELACCAAQKLATLAIESRVGKVESRR